MRKLVVLMLVLGIASVASAGLSFATNAVSIGIGETVVVAATLTSDAGGTGQENVVGNYAVNISGISYDVTRGAAVTEGLDTVTALGGAYAGYVTTNMGNMAGFAIGDEILLVEVTGLAAGTYDINIWNTSWTFSTDLESTLTVTVPEPITIGLLGLGGLFLRRRK